MSERRIIDVEAVALIALLGLGPGLAIHIDGGSAFYFSDVQRWLSLGLLLSWLPAIMRSFATKASPPERKPRTLLSRLDSITIRQVAFAFLLIPVAASLVANSVVWPIAMLRYNAETRRELYPPPIRATIPSGLHGLPRLRDHALLTQGLTSSPNFAVARALNELSALPEEVRRHTALFVSQDQPAYWTALTRAGACTFQPFLAPALASIAMIDGMPPFGCTVSPFYGLGEYAPRTRPQLPDDREPAHLCARAKAAGRDQVMVLTFSSAGDPVSKTIRCTRAT